MVYRVRTRRWAAWLWRFPWLRLRWWYVFDARSECSGAKVDRSIARLRRLLLPWETCSPRIDEPERRVTGVSPA